MSIRALSLALVALLLLPIALPLAPGAAASGSLAPTYASFAGPSEGAVFGVFVGLGGEPSIGVDPETGTILYQHGFQTLRVTLGPGSASEWLDVSARSTGFNIDPMLFTDRETGRTWAGGLDGACSLMAFTDDGGASWTPTGNMCVPTLDHQTIASGPYAVPLPTEAIYPRATYYCAQASAVTCITSFDGGLTWGAPVDVACGNLNPGFHGSLNVGPNGIVQLPFRNCGGGAGFVTSRDNGLTWQAHRAPGSRANGKGFDPDVATTPSGWTYFAYANGTKGAPLVTLTKDNGTTWSAPVDVGASVGVTQSTFQEMVAGDDERAAVAFLGTTSDEDGFEPGFPGVWDLYVATTYDAGATWTTVKASPDPVQRGWICDNGTGCSSHRNLLDFMDAQVDAQGRILVGYADGCINACAGPDGTEGQSTASRATITRQATGLTLFSAFDESTGAFYVTGHGPYQTNPGAAVALSAASGSATGAVSYAWSVLQRPEGSATGPTSFTGAATATPAFTPDILGTYLLRLEARDAAGAVAVDVVSVEAVQVAGGAPIAPCSIAVASDATGDSTAPAPGAGRREIVSVTASDAGGFWTLCANVANMADAPTSGARFVFTFDAPYEAPGLSYAVSATIGANGAVTGAAIFRGAAGQTLNQAGTPTSGSVVGDTLRILVAKPAIGGPQNGESATNLFLRVESSATPATVWDRAPDAGGASYTFGHGIPDANPPTQVTGLSVSAPGEQGVLSLSWSAASDDIGVRDHVVRRAPVPGGPYRTIATTSALSYEDRGLAVGTTYYYVVAARDAVGNLGAVSDEANGTTPEGAGGDATAPSAPASLGTTGLAPSWVALAWAPADDAESGIARYHVYRDGVRLASTGLLAFRDDGLAQATTYLYEVSAVNGAGIEGARAALSVTTPARPPDCGQAPYLLAADPEGDATRADGRADLVRVSVHETATRIWFHVGVADLTAPAPRTMYRVAWRTDAAHGFALYVSYGDDGPIANGMWVTGPDAVATEVSLQKQPQFAVQCSSLLIGIQKMDALITEPGTVLADLRVSASLDDVNAPASQTYDVAPEGTPVDYVVGSAA